MEKRMSEALDKHITGNYGEDQLRDEEEYEEPDSPEWEEKSRYGLQLHRDLCPSGFKFFSNIEIDSQTSEVLYYTVKGIIKISLVEYLAKLRNRYGSIQLTDAFDCYGRYIDGFTGLRFNEPHDIWYGVYVKDTLSFEDEMALDN